MFLEMCLKCAVGSQHSILIVPSFAKARNNIYILFYSCPYKIIACYCLAV